MTFHCLPSSAHALLVGVAFSHEAYVGAGEIRQFCEARGWCCASRGTQARCECKFWAASLVVYLFLALKSLVALSSHIR